ncbi:MAG: ATP-binding cassette domain-containing protein [Gemmatimonadetes bacterium]|nr:ATP-binding cassette domain-containing protein [Gemmatimonadota bacterium]
MSVPAVECRNLTHAYGDRKALAGLDFQVAAGSLFALLGPNGGGKSTLFRILATLMPPGGGTALVAGHDVVTAARDVRAALGVAFQSPSLDVQLSVRENLIHQGHLYGLRGAELGRRIDELLETFGLTERAADRAKVLSGGLARRVDLAKAMLHAPRVLLLDEPSTGLDPGARRDLLAALAALRDAAGTTVLLTTHFTDEAAAADGVAVLDRGELVAQGAPADLTREIGGDVVTLVTDNAERTAEAAAGHLGHAVARDGDSIRFEHDEAAAVLPALLRELGDGVRSATIARPTLEDVFFRRTGRTWSQNAPE